MNEIPLKQVIDASVENLKKAMSVDTVIGTPITLPDSTVVIPVSRVSVGFTSGGIDFDSKNNPKRDDPHFGGGNGAGMAVNPVGFLICAGSDVRFLPVSAPSQPGSDNIVGSVTELLEKSPSIIEKLKGVFSKKKEEEPEEE
ncbi:MAG: sporulation protein YtfJ [Clostridia bacterium]|nr:sporulation protein YtfJ [Clostridia bacterium]